MKQLLIILAIVIVVALVVFTGTWILDILAWVFGLFEKFMGLLASGCQWLSQIFNIFGWNNGLM